MKLTRVTITGADDTVDPNALVELSSEFPFAEWGVLYSGKRERSPRYPSLGWRKELASRAGGLHVSLHCCGADSRSVMAGDTSFLPSELVLFRRIQLNGFSAFRLPGLIVAREWHGIREIILQCADGEAMMRAKELIDQNDYQGVSVLYDPSGGTGKPIDAFPSWRPGEGPRVGFAGGISPSNVVNVLMSVCSPITYDQETWIDCESGVRDEHDRMDLGKVRAVLEAAKEFVVRE